MKKKFGLLTTTLLDYPGKVACTIFFTGCNFRCPYCQNAALVLQPEEVKESAQIKYMESAAVLSFEEILAFLSRRKNILEGVCISGGEPTLSPELPAYLCRIKNLGYQIKLDTNGTKPEVLRQLYEGNLIDMVAMDLKSSPASYPKVTGISSVSIEKITESIQFLLSSGIHHEFRSTLVKGLHTKEDIAQMSQWIAGNSPYFLQSFEDSEGIISKLKEANPITAPSLSAFSEAELQEFLSIAKHHVPNVKLRGIS